MKLLDLYKAILASAGATVDEDGLVSMTAPDAEPVPFRINDKRLAIPTRPLLEAGGFNPDGSLIAFHPICENVMLEPSPVLEKFETALTFRLRHVFNELILQLTSIAADHSVHKKLKMAAHGILSAMPNANDRTRADITKALAKGSTTGQRKLVSLYVRKGGTYGGEKVSRLGVFYPSIVDGLDTEKRTLWDVGLRKSDVEDFQTLIEYLLPDYKDPERYSAPSNSPVAPSLQALLKSFHRAANQLNKITELHRDHLENADSLIISLDWFDHIQDFGQYRGLIPVLPGNDGAEGVKKAGAIRDDSQTAVQRPQVPQYDRSSIRTAEPVKPRGPMSVDDLIRGMTTSAVGRRSQGRGWGGRERDPNDDLPPWVDTSDKNGGWGNKRSSQNWGPSRGGRSSL